MSSITITVPGDYPTISAAIAYAATSPTPPVSTIVVSAGVYNEHVDVNVAGLILQGAQSGVDARTRPYVAANESIITISAPARGTGIVNFCAPDITFDGFTVQGSVVNSTGGLFAGDAGQFLPNTSTIDVTGLKIINNIIQNNGNGVLIASIEHTPKSPNYLVQYNYLYNNSGDPNSGDGQGVFFNNSAGTAMNNVLVTDNFFNGSETSSSVNLTNVGGTSIISNNLLNQDNSLSLFGTTGVLITGNITSGATANLKDPITGIAPLVPPNTADAVFIGFGNTGSVVTNNFIYTASANGINILSGNSDIEVTNNCIIGNVEAGIAISNDGNINSNITINNNTILQNGEGLVLNANSYTIPPNLDATSNYWGSASGPNYNGTGPGTGQAITDSNIAATQSVNYTPFLSNANVCQSPLTMTKTTNSVNVMPGSPITYTLTLNVASGSAPFSIVSFSDPLPVLTSGASWGISSQSPSGFFTITGTAGSQSLGLSGSLPTTIAPGTYSVTIMIQTCAVDAGAVLVNTATAGIQIGGTGGAAQNITASATASVALCIHESSLIKMADGAEVEIRKLKIGDKIMSADGKITPILDIITCWSSNDSGNCIIFEADSLGPGVPSARFAIDVGHPMATPIDYRMSNNKALRYAATYVNGKQIYYARWNSIDNLFPGENKRFDLMMSDDSCKAYIANGLVVQSRLSRMQFGYPRIVHTTRKNTK